MRSAIDRNVYAPGGRMRSPEAETTNSHSSGVLIDLARREMFPGW